MGWNVVDMLCCIVSCYVYGWMALFGIYEADGKENRFAIVGDVIFFIIFTITIIVNFITDYTPQGETQPVRNLEKIAKRYLRGNFMYDFVAWFPFHWLLDMSYKTGNHRRNTIFLIKIIRLRKVSSIFNVSFFMEEIKRMCYSHLAKLIAQDKRIGENQDIDRNNIEFLMKVGYGLKTMKLAIIIFNISYFVGILWLIFCDFTTDPMQENGDKNFV